jgi:DNA-directed RNA polymerase subunit RPC12/RpoP
MAIFLVIMILIFAVFVVLVLFSVLASRNTELKCPNCSATFQAPISDQKITDLGFTFPNIGVVACPKCGEKRHRKDYEKIKSS